MRDEKLISACLAGCISMWGACAAHGQATRTWDNGAGTGKWSDAANWSGDALPEPGDAVVFDGAVSQAACAADIVTNQLGSITLGNGYTNRVAFAVNAVQGGMSLTVAGAITLASGEMTFAGDVNAIGSGTEAEKHGVGYDIAAASVSIAAGAAMHADEMGFPVNTGPGRARDGNRGASHGGEGGYGSISLSQHGSPFIYGNVYGPTSLGSGGYHTGASAGSRGGGALKITVTGTFTVNGRLSANAGPCVVNNTRGGAGGSIWIRGGQLAGNGVISASGADGYNIAMAGGGGGHIDISETVNNFAGEFKALGGCWAKDNSLRGIAGTIVFPQTAGTGLTMQHFVPYTNIALSGGALWHTVVVNPGITLWLDGNGKGNLYTMDSLVITGTTVSAGQLVCGGNIGQINPASGGTSANPHGIGVAIKSRSLVIHEYGKIHADGLGFGGGQGPGKAPATGFGGTHGGVGGGYVKSVELPPQYGTALAPTSLGSGGNGGSPGGGAIALDVSGTLIVNGTLSANGLVSGVNNGGGAGGSIWIQAPKLAGWGLISASGSDGVSTGHAGGGGGHIDLSTTVNDFSGSIRAWGGHPTYRNTLHGKAGTLMLPQSAGTGWTVASLVVTNTAMLGHSMGLSNVVVLPGGALFLDAQTGRWDFVFGSLTLTGTAAEVASVVCIPDWFAVNPESGGLSANRHGCGVTIHADTVDVGAWGRIEADGAGYAGSAGPGSGGGVSTEGGSYGGRGMRLTGTGVCYGVIGAPTALGSGGGMSGGSGGGAICINAGVVTNHGVISANAAPASWNHSGGSGGSVLMRCGDMVGAGAIQALGSYAANSRPGGGGRIAIILSDSNLQTPSLGTSAAGGANNSYGHGTAAAGTVYFQNTSDPASPGQLRFENPGRTKVDPVWTELPPRIAAGDATLAGAVLLMTNAAHVGLTSDISVRDLFLRSDSLLRLNGFTLKVNSYRHPDWGDEAWVVYDGGEIVWRSGTTMIVR